MKKVNPWQVISAILQAITALFVSLKSSHDAAHASAAEENAETYEN